MTAQEAQTSGEWVVICRRVQRIGVEQLWYCPERDQWAVSLDNRTYHQFFEIPANRVASWRRDFAK